MKSHKTEDIIYKIDVFPSFLFITRELATAKVILIVSKMVNQNTKTNLNSLLKACRRNTTANLKWFPH